MKLPARLYGAPRIDIGNLSVFCEGVLTANKVAEKSNPRRLTGYVMVKGKRIYWCRYGLVKDKAIYSKR